MYSRILIISALLLTFVSASSVYAVAQSNIKVDAQQQTQAGGSNETSQVQSNAQIQSETTVEVNAEKDSRDENETNVQTQNQNRVENQGEENQINEQERVRVQSEQGSAVMVQVRSQVANAVQEMLQVADRNGGIGQQVRVIAQAQNQNQEKLEVNMEKVQSRSSIIKFFIGPDYREINNAKKLLEQNREHIRQLNEIKSQLMIQADQQNLAQQVQVLEEANLEIENSLEVEQKGFSLFGWALKLFVR